MDNKLRLNFSPSASDLKAIEEWLLKEYKKYNDGFYCNWNIIERSFNRNRLISLHLDKDIIGFLVYSLGDIYVEIDIFEIRRDFRKMGYGKVFFDNFAKIYTDQNFKAIKLFCEPQESQHFWRKMDFIKFPDTGYSEPEFKFYKPLIDIAETVKIPNDLNKLELWDVEPHQVGNTNPCWCWNIEIEDGKLKKPILQACNVNWNLRWTKNGHIVKDSKIKYFSKSEDTIEFSPFMYIEKLTE